jgi:hypothetical protein
MTNGIIITIIKAKTDGNKKMKKMGEFRLPIDLYFVGLPSK